MPEILTPDLCVIGAGSGGLSVAAAAAALGVSVVLIEKEKMGGDCLNTGCIPSKALIAASRQAAIIKDAVAFGITIGGSVNASVDFRKVHDHVHRVITEVAPADSAERFGALGVRVLSGKAHFIDRTTVTVGADIAVKAGRYVVAAGSSPATPLIQGLPDVKYLTNETIFDLTACPEHLVVIGAGAVGLELAQAFRRLGAAVTVLDSDKALNKDDPECVAIVLDQFERDSIAVHQDATIKRVGNAGEKISVEFEGASGALNVEGSHLLIATGRTPNIDGLELAAGGIKFNARGITVDRRLRTSNKNVYAIGDIAGGPQFTHVANYHAGVVIRNVLFRLHTRTRYEAVPRVTYTSPEIAHVGMTEAIAVKQRVKFKILRWAYQDNDRALAERATTGHIKVLTDRSGKILGCTIVGAQASELIVPWTLAIAERLNIRSIADLVVPYPTYSEIGKRAAVSFFAQSLTSPLVKRIIGLLRWPG